MDYTKITSDERNLAEAQRAAYIELRDIARNQSENYESELNWEVIKGKEYLVRILNGHKKILGTRAPHIEDFYNDYTEKRTSLIQRITHLKAIIHDCKCKILKTTIARVPQSAAQVLRKLGNYRMILALLLLDFVAVVGMAYADSLRVAIPLFLTHIVSVPLIVFSLDVFLEEQIGTNEESTGSKRGLLLTLLSLVGAFSPFISSVLIDDSGSFALAYLASAASLIPVAAIIIFYFSDFSDPPYKHSATTTAISTYWKNINIRSVFLASTFLNIFFMTMVIYVPLYLTQNIGLSWAEFGVMMIFAQFAYVIFEYPIGIIADRYIGEKEMMAFGFLILALSLSWMAFVTSVSVLLWGIIMFISRVGASLCEVTTESYFFKQTEGSDAQIISLFRITRPLAYVVGAMVASLSLLYIPFNLLFIVMAGLMVPAIFFTLNIKDSR